MDNKEMAELAKTILSDYMREFQERNPHLSVYDFKKKKRKEEVQELDRVIDAKNKEITDKEEKNVELARDISQKNCIKNF